MRTQVIDGHAAGFASEIEPCGSVTPAPRGKLTAAEKRVLNLISRAKTNKEIAVALGISPATVKRHLENVLRKLHLKNRVELAIYGLMVAGCPRGFDHRCPLQRWHQSIVEEIGPFGR
ncbi:MAG: response regulator transcription factor [Alphaproteobacteria bacterium]